MFKITPTITRCCQPWCTDHADGTPAGRTPDPLDQLCLHRSTSPAYDEISMSYSVDEGTVISLHGTRNELTLAEAEQLAYALLSQVASARTAVAA